MQGVERGMTLLLQNKIVFHDFMKRDGVAYFSTLECFFLKYCITLCYRFGFIIPMLCSGQTCCKSPAAISPEPQALNC